MQVKRYLLSLLLPFFLFGCEGNGTVLTFAEGEDLYYKGGVTAEQAQTVGKVLQDQGLFNASGPAAAQLIKEGEGYRIRFILKDGAWEEKSIEEEFRAMGYAVSKEGLEGATVVVDLCDDTLTTQKGDLAPVERIIFHGTPQEELSCYAGISKEEGERVLAALKSSGYFDGTAAAAVKVYKTESGYHIRFAVGEGKWDDKAMYAPALELGMSVAKAGFDVEECTVDLCDNRFKIRKSLHSKDLATYQDPQ